MTETAQRHFLICIVELRELDAIDFPQQRLRRRPVRRIPTAIGVKNVSPAIE
jgi:hypothetical protein